MERIRAVEIEDFDQIYLLEQNSFIEHWHETVLSFELYLSYDSKYYLIDIDGEVIAYGGYRLDESEYKLMSICVKEEYRNLGYAKKLLSHLLSETSSLAMSLEVSVLNISAINLYKSFGFVIKDTLKDYYEYSDAYLMYKGGKV